MQFGHLSLKFLGVTLDNKLSFKQHIEQVLKKVRSGISALKMSRNLLNYRAKLFTFNALIKPHIDYCALLWHDKLNKSQTETFTRLQKRAVRYIFSAKYNSHTAQLFKISNITPFELIFHKESIIFLKKFQNNELPEIFNDILIHSNSMYSVEKQRSKYKFSIKIPTQVKKGDFIYSIYSEWNKSNLEIREPSTVNKTKFILKKNQKHTLELRNCTQKKCYICSIDKFRDYLKYTKQ